MDVKWNNTFDIILPIFEIDDNRKAALCCDCVKSKYKNAELPNSSETMSIFLSVMIHNAEKFEVDYNNIDIEDMTVMADMTANTQSYTIPDCISNFYGISNSVISIMDSISDIIFITFLWNFSSFQHYENYQLETTQRICNFLVVLCIGNLISVATFIAVYLAKQTRVSAGKKILLAFIFLMLSPFLPAFDWVLQKFQSYNIETLLLIPGCDGILLWFEQELVRNKIFIMESVTESCFQMIIQ
eukprot:33071_1